MFDCRDDSIRIQRMPLIWNQSGIPILILMCIRLPTVLNSKADVVPLSQDTLQNSDLNARG